MLSTPRTTFMVTTAKDVGPSRKSGMTTAKSQFSELLAICACLSLTVKSLSPLLLFKTSKALKLIGTVASIACCNKIVKRKKTVQLARRYPKKKNSHYEKQCTFSVIVVVSQRQVHWYTDGMVINRHSRLSTSIVGLVQA